MIPQLVLTFLVIVAMLDCCWALLAAKPRHILTTRDAIRNRRAGAINFCRSGRPCEYETSHFIMDGNTGP